MTAPLQFSKSAQRDIVGIRRRIAQDNPVAADRYVGRMIDVLETIAHHKYAGERRDDLRKRLRIFVFEVHVVAYLPTRSGIRVVRVLDGRQNWESYFRR